MPLAIGMEQQVQVRGSDGTILWVGTAIVGTHYYVVNDDTVQIQFGEGVRGNSTNLVIPRLETTAAGATPASDLPQSLVLKGLRILGAGDSQFFGVALEPIGVGKTGLVAGPGSICTVQTTATLIAIGARLGSSATAGRAAAITASTTLGTQLGICMKINQVAAPGTGSTGHAGILVAL